MLPSCAKEPASEGASLPPSAPHDSTLAPSAPHQAPNRPPNVQELIAEFTNVVSTTARDQVRIELQSTMTSTHTIISTHHPLAPITINDRSSESLESMPLEILRGPATLPQEALMNQPALGEEAVMGKHQFHRES